MRKLTGAVASPGENLQVITGQGACRSTDSATLPMTSRPKPLRPMGSHHNEVYVFLASDANDLLSRVSDASRCSYFTPSAGGTTSRSILVNISPFGCDKA